MSPFLDDSDDETINNILRCDFSFPSEYFSHISNEAKDLISNLLAVNPVQRLSAAKCLNSAWIQGQQRWQNTLISSTHLSTLIRRRTKKLNSVAPISMSKQARLTRPESVYKNMAA